MTRPQTKKTPPMPSKLKGILIGFPLALFVMLLENPGAFIEKPGIMLFGLLLLGGIFSGGAVILIEGRKPQTLREEWHYLVGKPKDHD